MSVKKSLSLNGGQIFLLGILLVAGLILSATLVRPAIAGNEPPPDHLSIDASQAMQAFLDDQLPPQELEKQAFTACVGGFAGTYPCNNVDLLAFVPLASMGGGSGNDVWGWTDSGSGREFALMGLSNGTAFVEITNPTAPVYLGRLPTHTSNSSWRDIKVYANHAFIVSEASGHGMQVFALSQLLTITTPPVIFSETAFYNGFGNAHNIVINEDSGFAYAVGTSTCSGGLHMVNIQNPTNPINAGCFSSDGYTHDAQCVNYTGPDPDHQGQEICFNSNEDTLTIVNVTNKAAPSMIVKKTYAQSAYTHQGWLTEDQRYFLLDDELDEQTFGFNTRTRIWDVSNLENPVIIGIFDGTTTAIDHNQYIKGNYSYQADYRAGLRILDISNVAGGSLSEVAYFDIYPSSNSASFNGAWSTYPYFPSGVVIISGIEQGLFVVQPNLAGNPTPTPGPSPTPTATPAPEVMHVASIVMSVQADGGNRAHAEALITIMSAENKPVSGATVSGTFSGDSSNSANGVTNDNGQITLSSSSIRNGALWTFCVDNVAKSGATYNPGANVETCDSTGAPPTPTPTPNGNTMHIGDLDGISTPGTNSRWDAFITITVHDASDNPIAGATVSGVWSNGASGSGSCVTNANGQCTLSKTNLRNNVNAITFTVTNVTHASYTYQATSNHDPDGDSNGTTIVVAKP
ncbi:MAG: choice-of-anchor B family protein [Anaerolineales bacterium]|nr:choice-of-anchor B family protein [Anaerolineales bacterium]